MFKAPKVLLAVLLLTAVLAVGGCGGGSSSSANAHQVAVTLKDFSINPKEIKVPAGAAVELTLKNEGTQPHDFKIEGLKVESKLINAGKTQVVKFKADKKGKYEVICAVAGHKESGMSGSLVVE